LNYKIRGDRLKALREASPYTFDEVADKVNISKSSLHRYETDEGDATGSVIGRFAQFYNVSTDYLLGLTDDPSKHLTMDDLSEMERKFIIAVRQGRIVEAAESFATLAKTNDKTGIVTHDPAVNG